MDCFTAGLNGDENMIGKQLRWPLYLQGTSGGDFWLDKRTSAYYCYRKYVRFLKGELIDRQRCYTDFPLIRYTDVILQWAEALIELNEFTPAKNLIDQVRARAHMPGITIGGLDAMREAVRYERRVEFPVEAVNFFDEVRWGTYKETKSPGTGRPRRPVVVGRQHGRIRLVLGRLPLAVVRTAGRVAAERFAHHPPGLGLLIV